MVVYTIMSPRMVLFVLQDVLLVLLSVLQDVLPVLLPVLQDVLLVLLPVLQDVLPVLLSVLQDVLPVLLPVLQDVLPVLLPVLQDVLPVLLSLLLYADPDHEKLRRHALEGVASLISSCWPRMAYHQLTIVKALTDLTAQPIGMFLKDNSMPMCSEAMAMESTYVCVHMEI